MANKSKRHSGGKVSVPRTEAFIRAGIKRWHRTLNRKDKKYTDSDYKEFLDFDAAQQIPRTSVAHLFCEHRSRLWIPPSNRLDSGSEDIRVRNFSFIDAPEDALKFLDRVVRADCTRKEFTLQFWDDFCRDLGPYLALSLFWNDLSSNAFRLGAYTGPVRKALVATGLDALMNMEHASNDADDISDVWPIPVLECRNTPGTDSKTLSSGSAYHAQQFVDCISNWFGELGFALTSEGDEYLLRMISEILENGIIHSQPDTKDGTAYLTGFMAKRQSHSSDQKYVCHITVLSLGATIYESMQTCSDEIRNSIESLVEEHKRGFRIRKKWTRQALWTLYALQDGVTRIADQPGGRGLMDLIEFFSELSSEDHEYESPKIAIISGNVVIRLSGQRPSKDGTIRTMALNLDNDLRIAPDPTCIWSMNRTRFPGTVLSMRFVLNQQFLSVIAGKT